MSCTGESTDAEEEEIKMEEQDIMKWQGYSQKYFGVRKTHSFQLKTLHLLEKGRDVLVIQSTSSGKSLCFQVPLPMITSKKELVLLIVPTVA